jgi:uncharacterized small protein (DUF1192 family)
VEIILRLQEQIEALQAEVERLRAMLAASVPGDPEEHAGP